ncbi:MAG: RNA-binding domain-containing protein [Nanoarchaeota archaeon]
MFCVFSQIFKNAITLLEEEINKDSILDLIKTGEGITLEFKTNISSNLGKEICAFANTQGGKILLGVGDSGNVIGIKTTNELKSQIQSYARNINPLINIDIETVEDILLIQVPEGDKKPYSVNGQFFLRIGANCQQLNREEIRDFFQKENLILFDNQINQNFNFEEDFDKEKLKKFLALAKITDNTDKKDILRNLFLLDGEYLKNAGVLFFCKDVKKFFIGATITCVLYQGNNKTNILDRKEFDSDILSNYNNALIYLFSKLNTNYIIKRERTEKLELPEEALREAIINAVVHRDYFSTGHIQIDIYLDRVEINNPGGLIKGLSMKDFGIVSLPRNPLIMDLMLRVQKVEKVGSGIKRIKDTMKEYKLNVKFESTGFFTVIFKRPTPLITPLITPPINLTQLEQNILKLIEKDNKITKITLSTKLNIGEDTIKEYLSKLRKKNIIKRIGTKGGHWEIIK